MMKATHKEAEGRRERRRRQTRERIEQAAISLFLERGFEAVTIEDIAGRSDVSKRSFFDYFPSKEDVVFAWQDGFAEHLTRAIASRPVGESYVKTVQYALVRAVVSAADERALRLSELIRGTPVLRARDQFKYARLEEKLTEALQARSRNEEERARVRLLAAVVMGGLRVGGERWASQPAGTSLETFAHGFFNEFWEMLADFGREGQRLRSD